MPEIERDAPPNGALKLGLRRRIDHGPLEIAGGEDRHGGLSLRVMEVGGPLTTDTDS